MRWQLDWRMLLAVFAIFGVGLFLGSQSRAPAPAVEGSAADRLRPVSSSPPGGVAARTVYVPVYSSIYLGLNIKKTMVDLAATVSVRNVSVRHPLVLEVVRYYDSAGKPVRDYITEPSELPPLATVEFVIQRADATGGPGANFLIQWKGPSEIDEPLIEAVMVGQSGNAGISFTSVGRTVSEAPR
jgi:uncharacterized protein DUF3124